MLKLGRRSCQWHQSGGGGSATTIRRATWTVYEESSTGTVTYTGQGYATGSSPNDSDTLINPVSITKADVGGRVNEQIQARASSTSGALASIIAAAGGGAAAFPQSSYVRWTTTQYTDCCFAASQRVYHTIPASGAGSSGTNYAETDYGYSSMKRQNRVVTPGGTITDTVYDARGQVIKTERYDTIGPCTSSSSSSSSSGSTLGNLIARSETKFDDRGRVYRTIRYAVDVTTGIAGNSLTDNSWFDDAGNVIKQLPAGSSLFTKTEYDSLNRPSIRYSGYDLDETGYPG